MDDTRFLGYEIKLQTKHTAKGIQNAAGRKAPALRRTINVKGDAVKF